MRLNRFSHLFLNINKFESSAACYQSDVTADELHTGDAGTDVFDVVQRRCPTNRNTKQFPVNINMQD